MQRLYVAALLILMAVAGPSLSTAGSEKGWFGLALSVDVGGTFFSPTLRTVKVASVVPSSPAASAGVMAGDLLLEIEGIVVEGAKADSVKAAMQKSVGESLHLKIKHGAEAPRDVVLAAVPAPPQ